MALKRLQSDEMLQVSAIWIDPQSDAHKIILASSDLAASLPRLTLAHHELAQNAQPILDNPRLDAIATEQATLDDRHDDIIRGAHGVLTGIALILGPDRAPPILELRDHLIPEGLSSVQKTYRAEAGQAMQLESRLNPDLRARAAAIRIDPDNPTCTLADFLDEWIAHGKRIGALEDEKALLLPPDRTQAQVIAARNKWIRIVNLFVATAEAAEIDPPTMHILFGSHHAAEAIAHKRAAKAPPPPPNQPAPPPNPATT